MATRRTPKRGSQPGGRPRNHRPGLGGRIGRPASTATAHRPRFTSRMAVLMVVVAVLVVSYASSMRAYLQQRGHINDLRDQIAHSQSDITRLEREKRRWDDKAFVQAQARDRLGWVLPGETSYQVIGDDGKPLASHNELSDPRAFARTVPESWWERLHGSLDTADHPPKTPTPATTIAPPPRTSGAQPTR